MKYRDIEKINIAENNPYQAEEDWITNTPEDGFMCDNLGRDAKMYVLKQKLNEVIDRANEIYKIAKDWENRKDKPRSK